MNTERMGQTADLTTAGFARWAPSNARERNFWIALACAAVLHASFFVGAIRNKPSHLGDPKGDEKAISVSLVTEADLKSRSTIAEPTPPPSPPPAQAQPPAPVPKPPQPEAKQQPQPEPPKPPEPAPEAKPEPQVQKPAEPPPAKDVADKIAEGAPDLLSLDAQNPADMKSETKPKPDTSPKKSTASKPAPKKQQKQRLSSLDLSAPPSMMREPSFSGGRSAAFQRPPGITRSGLNDAFARAVIRALQQTMPQLTDVNGRVTVRILLSESGNVVEVRLLAAAKDSTLTQDVVFAAKQTSYPIPPAGSNVADRTFMVTYVYD